MPVKHKSSQDTFPNWREPKSVMNKARKYIEDTVLFDVENNDFWHNALGTRPDNQNEVTSVILNTISKWPPLIPIYSHRYMPSSPNKSGNPVLSIWQSVDTVIYGKNLFDFFNREFHISTDPNFEDQLVVVPYWGELFNLNQDSEG